MNLASTTCIGPRAWNAISSRAQQAGRKRTWKAGLGDELIHDVAALQQAKKLNLKQAIAELHEKNRWRAYINP